MTDKQIIIDGCDVSGCCYYNKKTGICSNGFRADEIPYCNCFTCNYKRWKVAEKQLKAKEQECEELKKINEEKNELLAKLGCPTIATARMKSFTLEQQLDQLKAELTRANCQIADDEILQCDMREAIEGLKAENENWQKEYWKLEQGNDFLAEKNSKLKNCLTEIKEIAKVEIECKTYEIEHDCFNETRCKALNEHINFTEQILQKISEVEDEHD